MTKLKLEVGKYYRTRDGRKVGPMEEHYNWPWNFAYGDLTYRDDGRWDAGFESNEDLIAICTDTPALKVGDKVKVIAGYGTLFNGRTGIVTHVDGDDAYVASKSNLPTGYYQGGDFHLYFWGSELEPIPTIGTLAEIDAQVGDVVEWLEIGSKHEVLGIEIIPVGRFMAGKADANLSGYGKGVFGNEQTFRIISRASDAKSPVELSVDLDEAIKQVVAESQSGPVQLRKVIVPGVYGKVEVSEDDSYNGGTGIYINSMFSRADLIAARDVFNALIDAMPDSSQF